MVVVVVVVSVVGGDGFGFVLVVAVMVAVAVLLLIRRTGHLQIPASLDTAEYPGLGAWFAVQQESYERVCACSRCSC